MKHSSVSTDGTNQFVTVEYNSAESTVSCTFLNQQDDSTKFCRIRYGQCQQELMLSSEAYATTETVIVLSLEFDNAGQMYCYTVEAGNNSYTITVEGSLANGQCDCNHDSAQFDLGSILI